MNRLTTHTEPKNELDWAIPEALNSGTSIENIAHTLDEHMSRKEAIRLVEQLLTDKGERLADLEEDDNTVIRETNSMLATLCARVQLALFGYMNQDERKFTDWDDQELKDMISSWDGENNLFFHNGEMYSEDDVMAARERLQG